MRKPKRRHGVNESATTCEFCGNRTFLDTQYVPGDRRGQWKLACGVCLGKWNVAGIEAREKKAGDLVDLKANARKENG